MLKDTLIANKSYAVYSVDKQDVIDETAISVIRNDCPGFLLPMTVTSMNNSKEFRYEIMGGIRLDYASLNMKKQEAVNFLINLISPLSDCADWFLDYHNFLFDKKYIIINNDYNQAKYIYLPCASQKTSDSEVMEFIREIVVNMEITDDVSYANGLLKTIYNRDTTIFTLLKKLKSEHSQVSQNNFEPIPEPKKEFVPEPIKEVVNIVEEAAPAVQQEVKKALGKINLFGKNEEDKPKQQDNIFGAMPGEEVDFGNNQAMNDLSNNLFGDDFAPPKEKAKKAKKEKVKKEKAPKPAKEPKEKKSMFGFIGKKQPQANLDFEVTPQIFTSQQENRPMPKPTPEPPVAYEPRPANDSYDYNYDDRTEIEDDFEEDTSKGFMLQLESRSIKGAPLTILLNLGNGPKVVGRMDRNNPNSCDIALDPALTFVGRRHMRFEQDADGQVYIIDLDSKNHTYLNGTQMLPNHRYPVNKGDSVMISQKHRLTYRIC